MATGLRAFGDPRTRPGATVLGRIRLAHKTPIPSNTPVSLHISTMTSATIISLAALTVSLAATTWTVWYNLNKEKSDKINRTIDLQFRFFESDMVHAREVGWYLLEEMESKSEPITFQGLWDNKDESIRLRFDQLYRVMNFWLVLQQLGEEEKIDIALAKRIFNYEYDWWFWRFERLVQDTLKNARTNFDHPDVFKPFIDSGIVWLSRSTQNKPVRRAHASNDIG